MSRKSILGRGRADMMDRFGRRGFGLADSRATARSSRLGSPRVMTQERPVRKRRRWWIVAAAAPIVVVGLVAALPWLLGTPPVRRWLLSRADRALAPGGSPSTRSGFRGSGRRG